MAKSKNRKNSKAKQKLMAELRKTRAKINAENPELLAKMQALSSKMHDTTNVTEPELEDEMPENEIKVDRDKNLRTVMQLYQNASGSEGFESKLKQALLETQRDTTRH